MTLGRGADEHDPGARASLGEIGIFGQESVAGMNGVRIRSPRGIDHPINVQIGRADGCRFVARASVERLAIRIGKHRHRRDAHAAAGMRDTNRDFAAVSDQKFSDWQAVIILPGYGPSCFTFRLVLEPDPPRRCSRLPMPHAADSRRRD